MLGIALLLLLVDASAFTLGGHASAARPRVSLAMEFGEAFYSALQLPPARPSGISSPQRVPACLAVGYNYAAQYGPQPGDPILPKEGDTWEPAMPEGWVEVALRSPLGIVFEENEQKIGPAGVKVIDLVQDGNAAKSGKIQQGDQLVGVTGIRIMGGKYERLMCDCTKWDFDTVVDAIGSNTPKFNCEDTILRFMRPAGSEKPAREEV